MGREMPGYTDIPSTYRIEIFFFLQLCSYLFYRRRTTGKVNSLLMFGKKYEYTPERKRKPAGRIKVRDVQVAIMNSDKIGQFKKT